MITPTLAEAHALSGQLFRVAERARTDFQVLAADVGLTSVQARAVLWLGEPSPMSSLAEHLSCDASNVTGIADRLTSAGLVERIPGTDRRVKLLQLTRRGKDTRAKLADLASRQSTVIAKLQADERRLLATLLDKLLE